MLEPKAPSQLNRSKLYIVFTIAFQFLACGISNAGSMNCQSLFKDDANLAFDRRLDDAFTAGWNEGSIKIFLEPIIDDTYRWMEKQLVLGLKKNSSASVRQLQFSKDVLSQIKTQRHEFRNSTFSQKYMAYLLDVDRYSTAISFLNPTEGVSIKYLTPNAHIGSNFIKTMNRPYIDLYPRVISISIPQEVLSVEHFARAIGLPVIYSGVTDKIEVADGQIVPPAAFTLHDKFTHGYRVYEYWEEEIRAGRFEKTLRRNLNLNRKFYRELEETRNRNIEKVAMAFVFDYFRDYFQEFNLANYRRTLANLPSIDEKNQTSINIWIEKVNDWFPGGQKVNEADLNEGFAWLRTKGLAALKPTK